MRTVIVLLAAVLVAGCAHNGGTKVGANARAQAAEDEAGLAAELSGKVAAPPQDCISEPGLGSNRFYGKGVPVFHTSTGGVVYVNRLLGECAGVVFGRAVKIKNPTPRLCRGDVVTVIEPGSGTEVGSCVLGEFTPYRPAG